MLAYIVRRLLYALPILIGVNLLTFTLFFVVNTPDDMARRAGRNSRARTPPTTSTRNTTGSSNR